MKKPTGLEGKDLKGGDFFHSTFQLAIGAVEAKPSSWFTADCMTGIGGDEILLPLWLEHRP